MIDIQYIRDNPEIVKTKAAQKGYQVDIERLLELDNERKTLLQQVESLRARRNENADKMKSAVSGGRPEQAQIDEGKQIKIELAEREVYLSSTEAAWKDLLATIPNMTFDDVPVGDESASVEVGSFGDKTTGAEDHLDFATRKNWVDFERGTKVAGPKFYFLQGDLALLENALLQYALQFVVAKGFRYMTVPHMVNSRVAAGTGFAPRSSDQSDEYHIDGEDLSLIATAEMPLTGYHADEIFEEDGLPALYAGYSPSYRREAGAAGKHTRGLFRVHQFNKLELYAFTLPEQSMDMHEQLRGIEEELWQSLGIPYRVINIASGDLGAPAAKKYDIEYWSKVDGAYRELTSCSNCTDFQARNLNIRVRRKDGRIETVHTLNGTAVAFTRSLIALIENYQTEDGNLRVPDVLRSYLGGREVL